MHGLGSDTESHPRGQWPAVPLGDPRGGGDTGAMAERVLATLLAPDPAVAISAPAPGAGNWAGGPSALWEAGEFLLAYRLRRPVDAGRGYANVIARSDDGVHFAEVGRVTAAQFGAASLERPALVRRPDGGWRLYVSCSTLGSKHWWVEAIDADDLVELPRGTRQVVLPGDATAAWKDPVVAVDDAGWHMWACRHPLDGGDDEADRMTSIYLTSADGLAWRERSTALGPTPGAWDARGARITSVWRAGEDWIASYDGRASAAENWYERTAVAVGDSPAGFRPATGPTPAGRTIRYLSITATPAGHRLFWEASGPLGANNLCTAVVPPA